MSAAAPISRPDPELADQRVQLHGVAGCMAEPTQTAAVRRLRNALAK